MMTEREWPKQSPTDEQDLHEQSAAPLNESQDIGDEADDFADDLNEDIDDDDEDFY